jgi:hypothetical protein
MAIMDGKVPQVPGSVHPALREVIERGWATDPKQRPTMAQVCEILARANWCVFPEADAKEVAKAELELANDATVPPAMGALRFEKPEAESCEAAQIPALKGVVGRMKSGVAQVPALEGESAGIRVLAPENATSKSGFARKRAGPAPVPVQQASIAVQAGTLLAECASDVDALGLELKVAELLLAKGSGPWKVSEFKAKVVGKGPLLVLVEFGDGVSGGFAAVPFENLDGYTADPMGTSFVFSLRPTAARCPIKSKAKALDLGWGLQLRGLSQRLQRR